MKMIEIKLPGAKQATGAFYPVKGSQESAETRGFRRHNLCLPPVTWLLEPRER